MSKFSPSNRNAHLMMMLQVHGLAFSPTHYSQPLDIWFPCHLWYLASEIAPLSLFSSKVSDDKTMILSADDCSNQAATGPHIVDTEKPQLIWTYYNGMLNPGVCNRNEYFCKTVL